MYLNTVLLTFRSRSSRSRRPEAMFCDTSVFERKRRWNEAARHDEGHFLCYANCYATVV